MLRSIVTIFALLLSVILSGSDIIPNLDDIQVDSYQLESKNDIFAMTGSGTISGNIYTYFGDPLKNVNVKLRSNQNGFPKTDKTNSNGKYRFKQLESGFNYQIYPSKTGDELNGISFYDIQLLYRLLKFGTTNLSPYQYIAADINNDQLISTDDLVSLIAVLFRIRKEFTNNKSWRFVDANFEFFDESNPWPFTEDIQINNLSGKSRNNNFVAIKVGDLSGNASTKLIGEVENRTVTYSSLRTEDLFLKEGKEYNIRLNTNETKDIQGIQLFLDQTDLEILDISTQLFNEDGSYTYANRHSLKTIWYDRIQETDQYEHALLNIKVIPRKNSLLSELLKLDNSDLPSELYTNEEELTALKITLEFENDHVDLPNISIGQNYPNPFTDHTTIEFTLDKAGPLEFKIMDIRGAVIYSSSINGKKGVNTVNVSAKDFGSNGLFHYQFTYGADTQTKTMLVAR